MRMTNFSVLTASDFIALILAIHLSVAMEAPWDALVAVGARPFVIVAAGARRTSPAKSDGDSNEFCLAETLVSPLIRPISAVVVRIASPSLHHAFLVVALELIRLARSSRAFVKKCLLLW